tara:strand:- start:7900 stop:8850 length:951 start_codon:yes stop_codon:yes gene_type:complete
VTKRAESSGQAEFAMARAVEITKTSEFEDMRTKSSSGAHPHLQLVDGPIAPDARIGERMRAARLARGMEIDDVARQLRLRKDYIEAMEAMQVARLPKGFVNPYIRDYARVIGLDPSAAVDAFNEQCGVLAQADPDQVRLPQSSGSNGNPLAVKAVAAVLGLVLAAGLGWFGYKFVSTPQDEPVVTASPAIAVETQYDDAARMPVVADPSLQAATRAINLDIRATRRAWINIRGADGTEFIDRQMSRGESYDLRVGAGWTLSTQDAGAFTWVIDGKEIAPVGKDDQAMYTLSVDSHATELRDLIEQETASAAGASVQ